MREAGTDDPLLRLTLAPVLLTLLALLVVAA